MIVLIAAVHTLLLIVTIGNIWYLRRTNVKPSLGTLPRLSVLIPARNEEEALPHLLSSLLSQDYPDFEVVVYDDGSEDGTWNVLQSIHDPRVKKIRGSGPPPGWIGKVHALYQASRSATGEVYLFLDADARLEDNEALARLVHRFLPLPPLSVLTGLTRLKGGGLLLVSLVPNAILSGIPWFLTRRLPFASLGALNGQCWMIAAEVYHDYEPHRHLPNEVLEDVKIGRYMKGRGVTPVLADLQKEVSVFMYRSFSDAWHGFRKNAYLMLGGTYVSFIPLFLLFILVSVAAPFVSAWFLLSLYILKALTDRASGFPLWITLLTPLALLLCTALQLHSAVSHWTGRVSWKGRNVG